MDRQQAIEEIKRQEPTFLKKAKRTGYVCPKCSNGTGKDGDGIVRDKFGTHYKCFKCGLYADILELYGRANSIDDFNEQIVGVGSYYGINVDVYDKQYQNHPKNEQNQCKENDREDYTSFFEEAIKNIKNTDYPQSRGLSEAVINRFKLGYVENWRHPKAQNAPTGPRLIIPTGKYSYLARVSKSRKI